MNLLDLVILAILALFILASYYRGFLMSTFSIAVFLASWALALLLVPVGSGIVKNNEDLMNTMLYYTEGSEKLENVETARIPVDSLSSVQLDEIITKANLARPFGSLVRSNIATEVFSSKGIKTLGDYFNETIVRVVINILLFIFLFFFFHIVFSFVIRGVDYSYGFPVLRQFDSLMGAGIGVIRGLLAVFVLFTIVPILVTVLPDNLSTGITTYIKNSFMGSFFYSSNFLLSLIPGV